MPGGGRTQKNPGNAGVSSFHQRSDQALMVAMSITKR